MGLGKTIAIPVAAVTDIEKARDFYGRVLGLREAEFMGEEQEERAVMYEVNDGNYLLVYERPTPSGSTATIMSFAVEDLEATMRDLRARGVKFEDYDLPEVGVKTENGIARDEGGHLIAWFKDPSGNILAVDNALPQLTQRRAVPQARAEDQEEMHV